MRAISEIIVHCTATPQGRKTTVDEIRQWHLQRGWNDIGYHFVVYLDGTVHTGRPIDKVGAHASGHNTGTIGVVYVGGVAKDGKTPMDTRTPAQKTALEELLRDLMAQYPIKLISGHRDYAPKACPSFDARTEYAPLLHEKKIKVPVSTAHDVDVCIMYLQKLLTYAGFDPGLHDGIIGPKTKAAIRAFQDFHGLPKSGLFDTETVYLLRKLTEGDEEQIDRIPPLGEREAVGALKDAAKPATSSTTVTAGIVTAGASAVALGDKIVEIAEKGADVAARAGGAAETVATAPYGSYLVIGLLMMAVVAGVWVIRERTRHAGNARLALWAMGKGDE